MRKASLIVCYLIFYLVADGNADLPSAWALLIGVSEYQDSSAWVRLNADRDVELVRTALLKKGWRDEKIMVLQDQHADREGILQAFRDLIRNVEKGQSVIFHFSGHGQQVADNGNDEIDGYDEAIVPYDSPMYYEKDVYEGEKLIRDDELGLQLYLLRRKLGRTGQVLVNIDACHSGSGTRGFGRGRGTDVKMASRNYVQQHRSARSDQNSITETVDEKTRLAPMVSFFASGAHELNYECLDEQGNACGSLSYAFSKCLASAGPGTSYRGLFDNMKTIMAALSPRQSPQAEGKLDRRVLGGNIPEAKDHYNVIRQWADVLLIDGGTLDGLHPGTTIRFFHVDTWDPGEGNSIAEGTVQNSFLTTAEIHLDTVATKSSLLGKWAYTEQLNFGKLSMRLQVAIPDDSRKKELMQAINRNPAIEVVPDFPDLVLRVNDEADVWILESKSGEIITRLNILSSDNAHDLIYSELLQYSKARFIRKLEMSDPWLQLKMTIIPVREMEGSAGTINTIPITDLRDENGIIRFRIGDKFRIRISNEGLKPAYYTILDIQPDHKINVVIPEKGLNRRAEEYYILPGQTHDLPEMSDGLDNYWSLGPPYGNEMFKLIATHVPLRLRQIIRNRGNQDIKPEHPFEILFSSAYQTDGSQTRGRKTPNIPPHTAQVQTFVFTISE